MGTVSFWGDACVLKAEYGGDYMAVNILKTNELYRGVYDMKIIFQYSY